MDKIPSLIPTVVFIGAVNAGKSSLINSLVKQDVSIVSNVAGTTTDEVVKRFELLNVGPINIIDTAGLNDQSILAQQRIEKTKKAIKRASLVLYLVDASLEINLASYHSLTDRKLLVFNKIDLLTSVQIIQLKKQYPQAIFVSVKDTLSIDQLKKALTKRLDGNEKTLLSGIELTYNKIVHVIPIDSEAPKGRLILPQMQLIRECLDLDIVSIVLKESELREYLELNNDIGLIVTDSQAFKIVSEINKQRFYLTSYSILQAKQKGDLAYFIENLSYLTQLKDNPHLLLMESCSHNSSHEDIGRVKIPKMLKHILSKDFTYDFKMSHDFDDNLVQYDFILHCGSCMLSADIMKKRIRQAQVAQVPMSNYGLLIAYYNGILNEAVEIFRGMEV